MLESLNYSAAQKIVVIFSVFLQNVLLRETQEQSYEIYLQLFKLSS